MRTVLLPILAFMVFSAKAQLVIEPGSTFFIGQDAIVTVQGNITANAAIQAGGSGTNQGKIQLKGSGVQQINTNGFVIPRLEIDNTSNVTLTGDVRVGNRLEFTNGKFILGTANFIIEDGTEIDGAEASKFLETNGTGQARRLVGANVSNKVIPVGSGTNYTPFTYTTTGSTYGVGAYVAVQATGAAVPTPQRHPRTESYLATSWKVTKSGITGGNLAGVGNYAEGQVTGTEGDIVGMIWDGANWSMAGGSQNMASNTVGANVSGTTGEIYGMNKFVLANLSAILQGAYNSGTGLMTDAYRANNLLPNTDPYRSFTGFTHVQNNIPEEITNASVFGVQGNANHNIVDWVFVQLRASNAPSTVLQTRAALIRANGDIIDIDNASPLYFKNVDAGNFIFTVRHRNHLGISNNPASALALGLTPTAFNFSTSPASAVLGTAGTNYFVGNSVRQLFGGDVTSNGTTNYIALGATDRSAMLSLLPGGSPSGSRAINSVTDYLNFSRGDVNFSRVVNYIALSATDRSVLVSTILGGSATASRTQINP